MTIDNNECWMNAGISLAIQWPHNSLLLWKDGTLAFITFQSLIKSWLQLQIDQLYSDDIKWSISHDRGRGWTAVSNGRDLRVVIFTSQRKVPVSDVCWDHEQPRQKSVWYTRRFLKVCCRKNKTRTAACTSRNTLRSPSRSKVLVSLHASLSCTDESDVPLLQRISTMSVCSGRKSLNLQRKWSVTLHPGFVNHGPDEKCLSSSS